MLNFSDLTRTDVFRMLCSRHLVKAAWLGHLKVCKWFFIQKKFFKIMLIWLKNIIGIFIYGNCHGPRNEKQEIKSLHHQIVPGHLKHTLLCNLKTIQSTCVNLVFQSVSKKCKKKKKFTTQGYSRGTPIQVLTRLDVA